MAITTFVRKIRRRLDTYKPLVEISLSQENLLHNLNAYREHYPGMRFAPVLKSNAYGHGLIEIAQMLDAEDLPFFSLDSLYEARVLRHAGVKTRILILGYARPHEIVSSRLSAIDYAIVDSEQLKELARIAKKPIRVHLKIDTGMHRHGILPADLDEAVLTLKSNPNLRIVGICSHFADSEVPDSLHTYKQINRWNDAVQKVTEEFPHVEFRHIANSTGAIFAERCDTNVCRLGAGLYGFASTQNLSSDTKPLALKLVLEMRSVISSVREIQPGESVGYNAIYTATAPTRIATVPLGYFEGIDRGLSNVGSMQVHGKDCPIVGRVSMNMSSIDVSAVPGVRPGDQVIAISRDLSAANSVRSIAKTVGTIAYVILVHIPQHLKRVVE